MIHQGKLDATMRHCTSSRGQYLSDHGILHSQRRTLESRGTPVESLEALDEHLGVDAGRYALRCGLGCWVVGRRQAPPHRRLQRRRQQRSVLCVHVFDPLDALLGHAGQPPRHRLVVEQVTDAPAVQDSALATPTCLRTRAEVASVAEESRAQ